MASGSRFCVDFYSVARTRQRPRLPVFHGTPPSAHTRTERNGASDPVWFTANTCNFAKYFVRIQRCSRTKQKRGGRLAFFHGILGCNPDKWPVSVGMAELRMKIIWRYLKVGKAQQSIRSTGQSSSILLPKKVSPMNFEKCSDLRSASHPQTDMILFSFFLFDCNRLISHRRQK